MRKLSRYNSDECGKCVRMATDYVKMPINFISFAALLLQLSAFAVEVFFRC